MFNGGLIFSSLFPRISFIHSGTVEIVGDENWFRGRAGKMEKW